MEVTRGMNTKTVFSSTVLLVIIVTIFFQADYLSEVSHYPSLKSGHLFSNSSLRRPVAPVFVAFEGYHASPTSHAPLLNRPVQGTPLSDAGPPCTSHVGSVAFIKTHKTGSTTLSHIINRYGYQRNKSFVLSKARRNGHLVYTEITEDSPKRLFLKPLDAEIGDFDNYTYDMISVHVRYYREAMDAFMKPDTRYITIVRDPGTQFESAFSHFQFDDAFPASTKARLIKETVVGRLTEWLRHPQRYRLKLKSLSWDNLKGLRYYYAQNNQIFDLGLEIADQENDTTVDRYLDKLARELDMVIVTEYFEESLLVMKKQFCWEMEDILFIPKNERREQVKNYTIPPSLRDRIREWNSVDFRLYQRFNETLWRKVAAYGDDFEADLREYRRMQKEVFENCTKGTYFLKFGRYMQNVNYKPAKNGTVLCRLIAEHKREMMARVRNRQLEDITSRTNVTSGKLEQRLTIPNVKSVRR